MNKFLLFVITTFLTSLSPASSADLYMGSLAQTHGFSLFGASNSDRLGYSISNAGDINGDGIDDVIVGADMADPSGRQDAGIVYVIFGKSYGFSSDIDFNANFPATDGFKIFGGRQDDQLGSSVSSAGDINGDGLGDIIIGVPGADSFGRTNNGAAYVIYGRRTGFSNIDLITVLAEADGFKISGANDDDRLGSTVLGVGDINGDNIDDVVVGAPEANASGRSDSGAVYIVFGRRRGLGDLDVSISFDNVIGGFQISGKEANDQFGRSIGKAGDVNGDGVNDVIVGAQYASPSGRGGAGTVYVIYGKRTGFVDMNLGTGLPAGAGFQLFGGALGDQLGSSVSGAGDVNGDGIDDIIVGAATADPYSRSNAGAVYVVFGKSTSFSDIDLRNSLTDTPGFAVFGAKLDDNLGMSVCGIGDINGDGIDDVAFGAPFAESTGKTENGVVYVIYGRKSGLATLDLDSDVIGGARGFKLFGVGDNDYFGAKLSYAGDLNKDNGTDIIIGAFNAQAKQRASAGSAYVIFGVPVVQQQQPSTPTGPTSPTTPNSTTLNSTTPSSETASQLNVSGTVVTLTSTLNTASQVSNTITSVVSLINFSNPAAIFFNILAEGLLYVRYLKINYPPKLQYILDQPRVESEVIAVFISTPKWLEDGITRYSFPDVFKPQDFHSSFLVNFWLSILTFLIIAGVLVFACAFEYFTREKEENLAHKIFAQIKHAVKWNFPLAIFTSCYGDVSLFSSLEFRTAHFSTFLEILSFFVCLVLNTVTLSIFILMITVIRSLRKAASEARLSQNLAQLRLTENELQDYRTVFESFKNESLLQQSYLIIFSIRLYLFYTVLAYLFNYPLAQTILINIMGIAMLVYLVWKRPFRLWADLIQSVIQELILQVVHVCTLGLAILDAKDSTDSDTREAFGDVIIFCYTAFMMLGLLYLTIKMLMILRDMYKFLRHRNSEAKKHKTSISIRNETTAPAVLTNQISPSVEPLRYQISLDQTQSPFMDVNQSNYKNSFDVEVNMAMNTSNEVVSQSNAQYITQNTVVFEEEAQRIETRPRQISLELSQNSVERANYLKKNFSVLHLYRSKNRRASSFNGHEELKEESLEKPGHNGQRVGNRLRLKSTILKDIEEANTPISPT